MTTETSNCFFCMKPGPIVCDSPQCQQHDRELREAEDEQYRVEFRAAIKAAVRQRCKKHDEKLSRPTRWFYTVKCLVCVALRRNEKPERSWDGDPVEVGVHHSAKLYAGWEAAWIEVGPGVFSGWWYSLEKDGDWWL